MLTALLHLLAVIPALTLLFVVLAAWLLRRRPGAMRPVWLVAFAGVLGGAEALPLPEPAPDPWLSPGEASDAQHILEVGVGAGSYQTCGGVRTYGNAGAMYRYSAPISDQTNVTVGIGTYSALDGQTPSGGMRGSIGLEHRWAGGSVGMVAGALRRTDTIEAAVLPSATLRLGARDKIFVDASFLDQGPGPLPGPLLEVGGGLAFPAVGNRWEPLRVRAGVCAQGVYVAPTLPIGEVGNLDVMGAYGDADTWGVSARMRLHFDAAPQP
jgi:hypothetical protein